MTERRFYEMIEAGVIARAPKGKRSAYDLEKVRVAYIKHLREQAAGRTRDIDPDEALDIPNLDSEKAFYARNRREQSDIDLAKTRGELIPANEIEDAIAMTISVMKQRLMAIASKLAPQLAAQRQAKFCQQLIHDEIAEALQELSRIDVKG